MPRKSKKAVRKQTHSPPGKVVGQVGQILLPMIAGRVPHAEIAPTRFERNTPPDTVGRRFPFGARIYFLRTTRMLHEPSEAETYRRITAARQAPLGRLSAASTPSA